MPDVVSLPDDGRRGTGQVPRRYYRGSAQGQSYNQERAEVHPAKTHNGILSVAVHAPQQPDLPRMCHGCEAHPEEPPVR